MIVRDLNELGQFAKDFIAKNPEGATVALEGDLGAGKTTFVRAVIGALSEAKGQKAPRIVSPTYVLHQRYLIGEISVDHFDLYRLSSVGATESLEIGLQEAIHQRQSGFVFVEWPSKLIREAGITFQVRIEFHIQSDQSRLVHVAAT